ncbi:Uncharacterised protein [Shigella sonnei]|nr:Uncharacterised protein [Shigella sonnei]
MARTLARSKACCVPQGEVKLEQCHSVSMPASITLACDETSSVRSAGTNSAPIFSSNLPIASLRPVARTLMPFWHKNSTAFRPKPLVAPVTSTFISIHCC